MDEDTDFHVEAKVTIQGDDWIRSGEKESDLIIETTNLLRGMVDKMHGVVVGDFEHTVEYDEVSKEVRCTVGANVNSDNEDAIVEAITHG